MHILDVEISGFREYIERFFDIRTAKLMRDLKTVAELIREDVQDNIVNGRAVPTDSRFGGGGKLAKNTKATEKMKGFNQPMVHSGKLIQSIKVRDITNGYEVYAEGEENADKLYYNHYNRRMTHIFGRPFKNGARWVQARPVMGVRRQLQRDLKKLFDGR